jgi:hypothetical protein
MAGRADNDIFACCSALSFLDEKGFRYYIPAFMVYGLKHWGIIGTGFLIRANIIRRTISEIATKI